MSSSGDLCSFFVVQLRHKNWKALHSKLLAQWGNTWINKQAVGQALSANLYQSDFEYWMFICSLSLSLSLSVLWSLFLFSIHFRRHSISGFLPTLLIFLPSRLSLSLSLTLFSPFPSCPLLSLSLYLYISLILSHRVRHICIILDPPHLPTLHPNPYLIICCLSSGLFLSPSFSLPPNLLVYLSLPCASPSLLTFSNYRWNKPDGL